MTGIVLSGYPICRVVSCRVVSSWFVVIFFPPSIFYVETSTKYTRVFLDMMIVHRRRERYRRQVQTNTFGTYLSFMTYKGLSLMCISKNSMLYHLFYRHFYHGDVALRDRKVLEFSLPYFLSVELVTASRVFPFQPLALRSSLRDNAFCRYFHLNLLSFRHFIYHTYCLSLNSIQFNPFLI